MTQGISPAGPSPEFQGKVEDLPAFAKKFKSDIDHFATNINELTYANLQDDRTQGSIATNILELKHDADRGLALGNPKTKLQENIQDGAFIINTVLTQPLSVPGAEKDISLYSAAKGFSKEDPTSSDLTKVLYPFLEYPDATKSLVTEMGMISRDLEVR